MVDDGREYGTQASVVVAAGSFGLYLLLRVAVDGGVSLADTVVFTPSVGVVVPLSVLFGAPVVVGVVFAELLTQGLQGEFDVLAMSIVLSVGVLAGVSATMWGASLRYREREWTVDGLLGLALVALVASIGSTAVLSWGGELAGLFSFYPLFADELLRYCLATAVLSPPIVLAVSLFGTWEDSPMSSKAPASREMGFGPILVPVVWALLATVGSVGFNIRERIPREAFERKGLEFLYELVHPDIFGLGGRRVQVLLGLVMGLIWFATFLGLSVTSGKEHRSEDASVSSSRTEEMEVR